MELRNGTVVGQGLVPAQHHAAFEAGVRLIFKRWTALGLAVENLWGGNNSVEKADLLLRDIMHYFLRSREHYVDEVEEDLADALLQDFNVECEDGSPRQVAQLLMDFHQQCLRGDFSQLEEMQRAAASAAASGTARSQRQHMDRDGTLMDEGSSSDDDDDDDGDDAMEDVVGEAEPPRLQPIAPVIDEDGFELVQKKGGRRR